MEQKPQTTFVVPKETEQVVVTWAVDGKVHQSEPVEIERGKTYTITVGATHGGGGGAGLPTPAPTATPRTASVPTDTAPSEA